MTNDTLPLVATSVVTLVAVLLGSLLSRRSQESAWRREREDRLRDTRRATYARFLQEIRRFQAYLLGPVARITLGTHPVDGSSIALFDEAGTSHREGAEIALAEMRLIAASDRTIDAARVLQRAMGRLAVARASHAVGQVPEEYMTTKRQAESDFIDTARRELGLT